MKIIISWANDWYTTLSSWSHPEYNSQLAIKKEKKRNRTNIDNSFHLEIWMHFNKWILFWLQNRQPFGCKELIRKCHFGKDKETSNFACSWFRPVYYQNIGTFSCSCLDFLRTIQWDLLRTIQWVNINLCTYWVNVDIYKAPVSTTKNSQTILLAFTL